jgi:hypothetical protein
MTKPNLLIINAGWADAPFRHWTDISKENFDLAVLQWNDTITYPNADQFTYHEHIVGQKWRLVGTFNEKYDLSGYEYIQVMDEDMLTTPELVSATFDFCRDNNLDLAQPALTADSSFSHPATRLIEGAQMHITNTVEMMADIHSQRTWAECMDPCLKMPSGIGFCIEGYWKHVLQSDSGTTKYGGRVAVIDRYPVLHLKPVSSIAELEARGADPRADDAWFKQYYNFGDWSFATIEVVNE